jgi:hypothetical protein
MAFPRAKTRNLSDARSLEPRICPDILGNGFLHTLAWLDSEVLEVAASTSGSSPGFFVAVILQILCGPQTCRLREIPKAACGSRGLHKPRGNMCSMSSCLLPATNCPPVCWLTLPRRAFFDYTSSRRGISWDKVLPRRVFYSL